MILDYKDYVLAQDLAKAKGVTPTAITLNRNYEKQRAGQVSLILKESIPEKEQIFIKECTDLDGYTTLSNFVALVSASDGFFNSVQTRRKKNKKKPIHSIKVSNTTFIRLPKNIIDLHENNFVLYLLPRYTTHEDAIREGFEGVVYWEDIVIGYYS